MKRQMRGQESGLKELLAGSVVSARRKSPVPGQDSGYSLATQWWSLVIEPSPPIWPWMEQEYALDSGLRHRWFSVQGEEGPSVFPGRA